MSDVPRIGFVVEGPTDYEVLKAVTLRFLNGRDYVPVRIQPPDDAIANDQGEFGGGWKGVRRWCQKVASEGGPAASSAWLNHDVLVIHVDADVAGEDELADLKLKQHCPPAVDTCDAVRAYLRSELGSDEPVPRVVLCVPAQNLEAWVFAALHTAEVGLYSPIECRPKPETLLIGKAHRLVHNKDGKARKNTQRYQAESRQIAQAWPGAVKECTQAERFQTEMMHALP